MAHILVLDDENDVRTLIKSALERDGHEVVTLKDGTELSDSKLSWADCILLDVMMPGLNGFEICSHIRNIVDCPILFITAKSLESDVLQGFGCGGDDYIIKPFHISELRARVNAHLRREQREHKSRFIRGNFSFDMNGKSLYYHEKSIKLTKGEYSICEYLALHNNQIFSKEQIIESVFGYDNMSEVSSITEHIKNIRCKLKEFNEDPIKTIWGQGYKWKTE